MPPVRLMDFARRVGDLADHQEQVFPHLPSRVAAVAIGPIGEHVPEIVVDDAPPQPNDVAGQPGQQP